MIKAEKLSKSYGSVLAVDNLNFEIQSGGIVGFLGPNGAGKTTTMNLITCYLQPSSGQVSVDGYDTRQQSIEVRKKIGYLPEDNPLYEDMGVYEYLEFVSDMRNISGSKKTKRIKEIVDICSLKEVISKDIGELSRGYKQRVGFAQAIFHDPEILILDEPTSGLDPNQAREIRDLIKNFKASKTILLSTHILSEAQVMADRVMIINKGKIVADGTHQELYSMVNSKEMIYVKIDVPSDTGINLIKTLEGVQDVRIRDSEDEYIGYEIDTAKGADIRRPLYKFVVDKGLHMLEMHKETVNLEDIFRKLTINYEPTQQPSSKGEIRI